MDAFLMKKIPKIISKYKWMRSYRCPKAFYMTIHHPDKETPVTTELQKLFDEGLAVGREARNLFPGGDLIKNPPWEFTQSAAQTQTLIKQNKKTIYEAAFLYQQCYARMDIINYCEETKKWDLYEVKSSTKVKDEHIKDVALQAWIIAKTGLPINKIHLVHLNKESQFPCDIEQLFHIEEVTSRIREEYVNIASHLQKAFKTLSEPTIPKIAVGEYCFSPGVCSFKDYCWKENDIPKVSVLNLPTPKKWEYFKKGFTKLEDPKLLEEDMEERLKRMVSCHQKQEVYKNTEAIQKILSLWKYPLTFLDFETVGMAMPKWKSCSPYNHTPFQFSVHVLKSPGAKLEHLEFLHDTDEDPRLPLVKALLKACQPTGNLVAYYSPFEKRVIEGLAQHFTEYKDQLLELNERMQDPLPILKEHFYDPKFNLSYSLKSVAPGLLGAEFSYKNLGIQDGISAQSNYKNFISNTLNDQEKLQIRKDLLTYCKQDTLMLAAIVEFLFSLT